MKNFFDDVFDNKFLFEKEDLLKTFTEEVKVKETLTQGDVTDSSLEDLMADIRKNPERPFTKKESLIIKARLEAAKEKCKKLIEVVKDRKENLDTFIRASDKSFTLDISRNSRLRKSATNTFGGIKNELTYDDYMVLVEMKRVIELSETLDVIEGMVEDGSL